MQALSSRLEQSEHKLEQEEEGACDPDRITLVKTTIARLKLEFKIEEAKRKLVLEERSPMMNTRIVDRLVAELSILEKKREELTAKDEDKASEQ